MRLDIPRARGALIALAIALWVSGSAGAAPACPLPVPPDAGQRPAKPAPPERSACVDAKPGTAGCLGWEGHGYNEAIKAYNAKLPAYRAAAESYVARLNTFVQASADYARCEVQALQ